MIYAQKYHTCITHIVMLLAATCLVPCTVIASSSETTFESRGSVKSYLIALNTPNGLIDVAEQPDWTIQNQLRISLFWDPDRDIRAEIAYDLLPTLQEKQGSFTTTPVSTTRPVTYRLSDMDRTLCPSDPQDPTGFVLQHNLDRFYATFSPDFADIHLGRQPIAFGVARVINPTDVIAPYSFAALDVEDRIGVDALRMQIPVGIMGEVDIGVLFGRDFDPEQSAAFIRRKLYAVGTDITLLALDYKENLLIGLDIARSIGGAGVWLESAYTLAGLFDNRDEEQDFLRVSTGIDYHFSIAGGIHAYVEYHFNGPSESVTEEYLIQTDHIAWQESGVYLLGRHYLSPGMTWQVKPLLSFDASLLWNLDDTSGYITTRIEYNIREDLYLGAGVNLAFGDEPEVIPGPDSQSAVIRPASEFGLYPDLYFAYLRFYF